MQKNESDMSGREVKKAEKERKKKKGCAKKKRMPNKSVDLLQQCLITKVF